MTTEAESTAVATRDNSLPPEIVLADTPPTSLLPTRGDLEAMSLIAGQAVKATGMIPSSIKTKEQALAVILAGWELGLRPMTALRHCYVVNGRTEIETRAMVGIVKARDPRIRFEWPEYTSEAVTCIVDRPGQAPVKVRYTVEDAKASGQLGKGGPWTSFRRDMLYAAATKRAVRLSCPDIINAIDSGMTHAVIEAEAFVPRVELVEEPPTPDATIPAEAFNEGDDGSIPVEVQNAQAQSDDDKRAASAEAQHHTGTSDPTEQHAHQARVGALRAAFARVVKNYAPNVARQLVEVFGVEDKTTESGNPAFARYTPDELAFAESAVAFLERTGKTPTAADLAAADDEPIDAEYSEAEPQQGELA